MQNINRTKQLLWLDELQAVTEGRVIVRISDQKNKNKKNTGKEYEWPTTGIRIGQGRNRHSQWDIT